MRLVGTERYPIPGLWFECTQGVELVYNGAGEKRPPSSRLMASCLGVASAWSWMRRSRATVTASEETVPLPVLSTHVLPRGPTRRPVWQLRSQKPVWMR